MMHKILTLSILSILCLACKPSSNDIVKESPAADSATSTLPVIPTEILIDVYENCDFVDIIFRDLPFSISQEDKGSIQATIRNIANIAPPSINSNCPYFAQLLFQENGEIKLDGKLFFQQDCTYYIFYEEGIAKYSGTLTNEGIQFYNRILAQAEEARSNG